MSKSYISISVFLSYAATSAFFWKNPHLLHKKKSIPFKPMCISHRGGAGEGYENTIRNFRQSLMSGADMLELDVRVTKDDQIVVFHDATLTRLIGIDAKLRDIKYSSLPPLKETVPIDSLPGLSFCDTSWTSEERRIPLLREVFQEFPGVPINIDVKDGDEAVAKKVSELVTEFNRENSTVWGCGTVNHCQLDKVNPNLFSFCSAKKVLMLIFFAVTGLLPFIPIRETHFEVFLPMSIEKRLKSEDRALLWSEVILLKLSHIFLTWKPFITHLIRRGIHVYFWVCNSEEEFKKCLNVGATGIMTDYPTKLSEFLGDDTPITCNSRSEY